MMQNVELAQKVATVFVRDVPSHLGTLSQAIEDADPARVRLAAHSLRGAASTVGGTKVGKAAAVIEKLGEAGELVTVRTLLPQLVVQAERLRAELEQFCAAGVESRN